MPARPTPKSIAATLSVPQRLLLFCVASGSDYRKAGINGASVQLAIIRGLVERDDRKKIVCWPGQSTGSVGCSRHRGARFPVSHTFDDAHEITNSVDLLDHQSSISTPTT